jgi:hypothetical protein
MELLMQYLKLLLCIRVEELGKARKKCNECNQYPGRDWKLELPERKNELAVR